MSQKQTENGKRVIARAINTTVVIVLVVVLLLHARMFLGRVWSANDYAGRYSLVGQDGRSLSIDLEPSGDATVHYRDDYGKLHISNAKWRGSYATRIIGPIYKPHGHFYRWVSSGTRPVLIESEYTGLTPANSSIFPKPGKRITELIYFREDGIKFDGMWLNVESE